MTDHAPHTEPSPHDRASIYLTASIPGTGGTIKQRHEDFLVEEQPLYQPSGKGEHIYLFVEKRGLSTLALVDILAGHFQVPRHAVGYAGLKDSHAITRQVFSIHTPGKKPEDFPMLTHPGVGVLWTDLHDNKLRRGHLAGNRFSIRIRNVDPFLVRRVTQSLAVLESTGVPNRFGEQRFGLAKNNHLVGKALLADQFDEAARWLLGPLPHAPDINARARAAFEAGDVATAASLYPRACRAERVVAASLARGKDARQSFRSLDDSTLGFFLSAAQSAAFNAVLDRRLTSGSLAVLDPGDIAMKRDSRACFMIDEATSVHPDTRTRLASLDINPTGPMWGPSMMRAMGETDARELEALAELGLTPESIAAAAVASRVEGERRPLRVPLTDPDAEGGLDEHGPFIRVAFELPRGAYATVVLRELMKPTDDAVLDEQGQGH